MKRNVVLVTTYYTRRNDIFGKCSYFACPPRRMIFTTKHIRHDFGNSNPKTKYFSLVFSYLF